ncbi:putative bifunctional diguanylate cyclase/phosphodiesterase [Roseateles sp. LYH14W]|uniref:Bifunctional diguanylate cyclase/phosphodiesterase n=1 Tax=Pelomonas parva TaxID=3299032 RepID=A0ABW7F2R7_9BURK
MSGDGQLPATPAQAPPNGAVVRVLFADDEAGTRTLMRAALRKLGLDVTLAADGREALDAFQQQPHTMVLLDVDMPELDGYEVCRRLRRQAGPLLPIVMVTGRDDVASVQRAYECGATDFIVKPINWSILGHRVSHLLRNYDMQRELHAAEARTKAILQALPDLLIELDADGRFIECHAPASEDLAHHLQALPGRTVSEALSPKLIEMTMAAIAETARTGRSTGRQYRLHLPGGDRWFELSMARKAGDGDVARFIALSRDITERKAAESRIGQLAESLHIANIDLRRANDELQRQAFQDPLSGLPNRAMLNSRLQQALRRISALPAATAQDAKLAVLFIDLDGFKPINDSFGHAAGDEVLREVAKRLRAIVRESDVLARLGGDEFVALIESPEAGSDALRLGARIIDALKRPFAVMDQKLALSCSIGVVVYPDQERSGDRLLACADAAMYAAKRIGGSACVPYDAGMSDDGTEQVLMQQALRESLERGALTLFYQPKVDSVRGRIYGLEALLRWQHDRFGIVPPSVFIPLAERFGLIGAIGDWVLEEACAQLAAWHAQGLHTRIAINLSAHQLRQPDLVERMRAALRRHGLHPGRLTCEITESAMMENSAEERGTLDRIAALGVRLSIDDFGTGYSSLAQLRHIPARQLKIDRSFVVDLTVSAEARAVVEAIVQLAHALRLEVVAEGVESEEQLQVLRDLGCDVLQGFHVASPMPADEVPVWMSTRENARREGVDTSFDSLPGHMTQF